MKKVKVMNYFKKVMCVLVSAIIISNLSACGEKTGSTSSQSNQNESSGNYVSDNNSEQTNVEGYGNNSLNIINGGKIAYQDGYYYYNNGKGIYKIKEDGTEREQITLDDGESINVLGEWIYYRTKESICKIRTDGSEPFSFETKGKNINVVNDWIYYTDDGLYKMKIDGTETELLTKGTIEQLTIQDEWIFFWDYKESGIYKIKTDGTEKSLIYSAKFTVEDVDETDSNTRTFKLSPIVVVDDWIYFNKHYVHGDNQKGLYRIKTDGTNLECIVKFGKSDYIDKFALFENELFWSGRMYRDNNNGELEDVGGTFKSNLDGSDMVKISDDKELYDYSLNGFFIREVDDDNDNIQFKLYDNNENEMLVIE
ncbi:MAG: DUF5050 domain-containing protein [Roseburia sp.]